MSQVVNEHRRQSPQAVRCAVITVSDTRTSETDTGGALVAERLTSAGHSVVERRIIRDEPAAMRQMMTDFASREEIDAILLTGGTGLSSRDRTYETVCGLLTKAIPGYGELFRMLSYQQIGTAAMLSRAVGGLIDRTVVLTMPGSPAAVQLAMDQVILPELCHLVREAKR